MSTYAPKVYHFGLIDQEIYKFYVDQDYPNREASFKRFSAQMFGRISNDNLQNKTLCNFINNVSYHIFFANARAAKSARGKSSYQELRPEVF